MHQLLFGFRVHTDVPLVWVGSQYEALHDGVDSYRLVELANPCQDDAVLILVLVCKDLVKERSLPSFARHILFDLSRAWWKEKRMLSFFELCLHDATST